VDFLSILLIIGTCALRGAAEVADYEFCVGDGICRKGGCALTGYRGAQSFGRLADRKREGRVLLNFPELCHRIPAPYWHWEPREPQVSGEGHGAACTDSRFSVVAVLLCGLGCRQFLFNHGCWSHGEILLKAESLVRWGKKAA